MGGQGQAVLHRRWRVGGRDAVVLTAPRDQLERRRVRRPPDDDAVQRADSDGAAVFRRRTRRVLRSGPVRDRDLRIASRWRNLCASRSTTGPRAIDSGTRTSGSIPMETGRLRSPVEFPPDGATVNLQSFAGDDYPDPLTSCPGYKAPTGTPISIQLGQGYGPDGSLDVSSDIVTRDGVEIETCLITAASYVGRDADADRVLARRDSCASARP